MSNQGTQIETPNGKILYFVEEDHSYWRHNPKTGKRGRRLTGVTTAVKTLDVDPTGLMKWAAKTQLLGAARLVEAEGENAVALLEDPERCWAELVNRGWTYDDVRDQAASEGTNVHEHALEALAAGKPAPNTDGMSEREQGLAQAVHSFWFDHSPIVHEVERVVYSERLGVAGRLDLIAELGVVCDNEACACRDDDVFGGGVIDLKTGNYISPAAHTQVGGGYPLLARESGFDPGEWALILKVKEDGTYELIKAEGTTTGFEIAVMAYRESGRINGAHQKASKQRKEIRETAEQEEPVTA